MKHQLFGKTDLQVPQIVYGSSSLGNLFVALPDEVKLAITREWFAHHDSPVVIDSSGKYGAGLALEMIGKNLRELNIASENVVISNKLGWKRVPLTTPEPTFEPGAWIDLEYDAVQCISYDGIFECWEQGCELLGEEYRPQLLSVHDPDEYLAAAGSASDRQTRLEEIVSAYRALKELRSQGKAQGIGVGAKDWRVVKEIAELVDLDWVMLANSLTIYRHPQELLDFLAWLNSNEIAIINSAVFHAGFLIGGQYFDYEIIPADDPGQRLVFDWREKFLTLCKDYKVEPAIACIQFGLSPPGVLSIALNTSKPENVARNVKAFSEEIPTQFWSSAKKLGLISSDYPFL